MTRKAAGGEQQPVTVHLASDGRAALAAEGARTHIRALGAVLQRTRSRTTAAAMSLSTSAWRNSSSTPTTSCRACPITTVPPEDPAPRDLARPVHPLRLARRAGQPWSPGPET